MPIFPILCPNLIKTNDIECKSPVSNSSYFSFLTDRPTEVQLGIYILSFFSISEQTMASLNLSNIICAC